jgi:hypothetical protein
LTLQLQVQDEESTTVEKSVAWEGGAGAEARDKEEKNRMNYFFNRWQRWVIFHQLHDDAQTI